MNASNLSSNFLDVERINDVVVDSVGERNYEKKGHVEHYFQVEFIRGCNHSP